MLTWAVLSRQIAGAGEISTTPRGSVLHVATLQPGTVALSVYNPTRRILDAVAYANEQERASALRTVKNLAERLSTADVL